MEISVDKVLNLDLDNLKVGDMFFILIAHIKGRWLDSDLVVNCESDKKEWQDVYQLDAFQHQFYSAKKFDFMKDSKELQALRDESITIIKYLGYGGVYGILFGVHYRL